MTRDVTPRRTGSHRPTASRRMGLGSAPPAREDRRMARAWLTAPKFDNSTGVFHRHHRDILLFAGSSLCAWNLTPDPRRRGGPAKLRRPAPARNTEGEARSRSPGAGDSSAGFSFAGENGGHGRHWSHGHRCGFSHRSSRRGWAALNAARHRADARPGAGINFRRWHLLAAIHCALSTARVAPDGTVPHRAACPRAEDHGEELGITARPGLRGRLVAGRPLAAAGNQIGSAASAVDHRRRQG